MGVPGIQGYPKWFQKFTREKEQKRGPVRVDRLRVSSLLTKEIVAAVKERKIEEIACLGRGKQATM